MSLPTPLTVLQAASGVASKTSSKSERFIDFLLWVIGSGRHRPVKSKASSYLLDRSGVLRNKLIGSEQADPLDRCLSNQHAIKGILVNGRQTLDCHCMFADDGQFAIPIVEQPASEQSRIYSEIIAPEPTLDRNFPQAGGAEQKLVFR